MRFKNLPANRFMVTWSLFAVMIGSSGLVLSAQEDENDRITGLEKRLQQIESRLKRIENVLFASIRYSEAEARKQLDEARETLAQSERLHTKGMITAAQLELDRMSLNRASTLLKMCLQHEDHRKIGATLALMDAKQSYERRQLDLQRAEQLFRKGFIAKQEMARDRAELILAGQKLKLAEDRLEELKKVLKPDNSKSGDGSESKK